MNEYKPGKFSDTYEIELGRKLWEFLNRDDNIIRLETACDLRRPAVESVARGLLIEFGDELRETRIKQMIGHMIKQILWKRGFALQSQNVIIRPQILFSKGSRYERMEFPPKND